jgi:hypothetical protein
MRTFKTESVWDNENSKWVEVYYIEGCEVEPDVYLEEIENEEYMDDEDSNVEENNCDNCNGCCECEENIDDYEEDECDCPMCQAEHDVQELDCYCAECNYEYEKEAIEECLNIIFDDSCPDCIIESVVKLGYKFKELGKQSVKQEIREFLDD